MHTNHLFTLALGKLFLDVVNTLRKIDGAGGVCQQVHLFARTKHAQFAGLPVIGLIHLFVKAFILILIDIKLHL